MKELIGGPGDLFLLAFTIGGVGTIVFLIAKFIMNAIELDINEYANETSRYRNMGLFEQMRRFLSDARNIPVSIGAGGLFLIFNAVVMALAAGAWFIIRVVSD